MSRPAGPGRAPDAEAGSSPAGARDRRGRRLLGDDEHAVRDAALRRLEVRDRSRAELERTLAERGADQAVTARVLASLEAAGLVDDDAFAHRWVESRHRTRGLGRAVLRQELRRHGVDDALAGRALEQVGAEDERDAALDLARRRLPSLARLAPEVARRRLVGQLARRGHPPSVAVAVADEVLGESDEGVDAL